MRLSSGNAINKIVIVSMIKPVIVLVNYNDRHRKSERK